MFIVEIKEINGREHTHDLDVKTMEEAIEELKGFEDEDIDIVDYYGGSSYIESVWVHELGQCENFLKIHNARNKIRREEMRKKKAKKDKKDRKTQYEKLKKEFEDE